jgi:alanine racemase/UDP-N-acetylmuramoyl-tripeptide--D-alanyl-D-alanine ligase
VELRERGISTPIMVMNPDASGLHALCQYRLEPEIYDLALLDRYIRTARLAGLPAYPIHLKFDTGMGRLGFSEPELPALCEMLLQHPDVQVVSVMSHLAAADEPDMDDFTHQQAERFLRMCGEFSAQTGLHPWRHLLNTAGIERFPQYAGEMVRMGIGLYSGREEIGRLVSTISQIHLYPAGTSVGYGRSTVLTRDSRIATIPIGYADGIPRSLSNGKIGFLVHGQPAPIVGRVCMDMLMLDVTDIPAAAAGSEVVLWGHQGEAFLSIHDVAKAAGTIAYELLVRVSPRVRRVYVRE